MRAHVICQLIFAMKSFIAHSAEKSFDHQVSSSPLLMLNLFVSLQATAVHKWFLALVTLELLVRMVSLDVPLELVTSVVGFGAVGTRESSLSFILLMSCSLIYNFLLIIHGSIQHLLHHRNWNNRTESIITIDMHTWKKLGILVSCYQDFFQKKEHRG